MIHVATIYAHISLIFSSESGACFDNMYEYEGDVVKRFMNLVALQPLVVDEAFMPHMTAMDVPFHTMYGGLICFEGLHSDRPKC